MPRNLSSYDLRNDVVELSDDIETTTENVDDLVGLIRVISPTLEAEAANTRRLLLQVEDKDGVEVEAVHNMLVEIRNGLGAVPADLLSFRATDGGVGSLVVGGAGGGPHYIVATDNTGLIDLDITDVAGGSGQTVQIIVMPLNFLAAPLMINCAFD